MGLTMKPGFWGVRARCANAPFAALSTTNVQADLGTHDTAGYFQFTGRFTMTRRKPSFDQLTSIRIFGDASYSPEGDRFAYLANTSGSLQLWLQPAGGGFPLQLTALADWRVTSFKWSPDGRRIAFAADRAGSEMHQLFVLDVGPQGSWPKQLTDLPSVQHSLAGWTADGRIVFSANDRVPTEVDPQLLDPDSLETTRLMTGALHYA